MFGLLRVVTKSPVFSLDSNWLFNQPEKYPFVKWLDRIFLNFPEAVFANGLAENGGPYTIPEVTMKKIVNVGLIPSYTPLEPSAKREIRAELGLTEAQKLIFIYIGSGTTLRRDFHDKCLDLVDALADKYGETAKVLFVQYEGPDKAILLPESRSLLQGDQFYKYLASADLVFQHQGLGTLEQAISAQVPVIANVNNPAPDEKYNAHAWEVAPFEKAGLCKMHYYNDENSDILESIDRLLASEAGTEMKTAQKSQFSKGEESLLNHIRQFVQG